MPTSNPVRSAASSTPSPSAASRAAHPFIITSKALLMPRTPSAPDPTIGEREARAPRPNPHIRATLERVHIQPGGSTSAWLWRRDLDLLRALYRSAPGGYSLHIRAAVHAMCETLRHDLRASERGRELLTKLGQDNGQHS